MFFAVYLEVNTNCNRRCHYCTNAVDELRPKPATMSDAVLDRCISELARLEFGGVISYHHYNEPLLRKDLEAVVERVRRQVPRAFQLLFTNGDLLSDSRYQSLIQAGVDRLLVTNHGRLELPDRPQQTVQSVDNISEILNNRGGSLQAIPEPLTTPCYGPTEALIVSTEGNALLCCNDYSRSHSLGNVMEQRLDEIWFSAEYVRLREALQRGERTVLELCAACDDVGSTAPGEATRRFFKTLGEPLEQAEAIINWYQDSGVAATDDA